MTATSGTTGLLGHHLEGVGLGNDRQDQVHFHEGEWFAKTSPRSFTKRDIGTPVPGRGLRRCEALRLKLLRLGPPRRMPMDHVLADHHQGILRDRIATLNDLGYFPQKVAKSQPQKNFQKRTPSSTK